jgi:hypothetical protein
MARTCTPLFEVAFVDEDALPPRLAPGGLSSAMMLGAKRLVVVRRAHGPAPAAAPCAEPSCVEVSRPLAFEAFCSLCAQLLDPTLVPCPERFEYHTRDVLHDIWGEGTAQDGAVPRPVLVAPTAAACAKRKRVDAFSANSDASTASPSPAPTSSDAPSSTGDLVLLEKAPFHIQPPADSDASDSDGYTPTVEERKSHREMDDFG